MRQLFARVLSAVLAVAVSGATEPLLAQSASTQPTQAQQQPSSQTPLPPVELPENPGKSAATQNQQNQTPAAQPAQAGSQPSGTAVAPRVEVSGGAASKPAGVALAPPKQRQIRSLLIKFGFIAGAGIALGTVVGLSAASPGHVPNSPGH
jgi:hypothetical protein